MNQSSKARDGQQCFPALRRVRTPGEFRRCQQTGRRLHTSHFVLVVYARGDDAPARLGLTVSRRTGNAVARNRMKRLLRQAFRTAEVEWPRGIDLVIIAKQGPGELSAGDVSAELGAAREAFAKRVAQARKDAQKRASKLAGSG
ncbi:MAG: ribonuclease P protein component [Polyangiaceae bacterium]|nr:ribonuclease P protein component [Myxococcales bacterium]MCB9589389.1 ribonuclease P protein component [Polyangiaceae bacterium]